jgi:hypothetical protein
VNGSRRYPGSWSDWLTKSKISSCVMGEGPRTGGRGSEGGKGGGLGDGMDALVGTRGDGGM